MTDADGGAPATISLVRHSGLPGRHKAAVLLVSLGPEHAARVFRHMREDEIESLALEMARLDNVDSSASSSVFEELAATLQARESTAAGGIEYARDVLELAVGRDRSVEIVGRLSSVIERRPFEFLRRTPAEQIVTFLRSENPQTVALVVASLHASLAAQVLAHVPEEEQADIALRIARMGETSPEVVRIVEQVVRGKLAAIGPTEIATTGGVNSLAEILNQVDRTTERVVLDAISTADEELGEEVRRRLFVFEDIAKLDDRAIQMILRDADQKDLSLALRGVVDEVKNRILGNMSERAAQMLAEEMEIQPPQRRRVVEEAQGRIVAIVRRLEEADELVVSRGETDVLFEAATRYDFQQLDTRLLLAPNGAQGVEFAREQAWTQGEAEGREAGLRHAAELARPALDALGAALADVDALRDEVANRLERDAVELALVLAEQILGAALEVQPERVIDSVRGALRRLNDRLQVTAVVNPDDLELVSSYVDRLRGELGGIEHLGVQADRRVARGGAVMRTAEGEIDAQIATQLERARAVVAAELTSE